ncbi:Rho GTPase activation protein [Coemansia reversa NRRL 1564]|uniref:Rho GTPase activation protein n=1 Tax=Coemansia reversa (strain ATCC 12441 / NRRL 1564) TaxID=763665 RepID=A0A2G5B6S7_COERN|nr:Rho GTPase activation protein [Coemansia reversa NRRL 1564]|eukprot:PIA14726.1 Rho GTPase activation protein [Coemansia reversa NRRL 1564]
MDTGNGFADFAKKFNDFGNQLGNNIKRVFSESQETRRTGSSSDDVLGLDAEAFREATIAGNDGGELASYVNEKLVYEAGVDLESRPMLVFAACRLLNPDVVDYDRLLNLILFRLDDFVESDYTVVLFAANARYKPSAKWLYTAYRRLGRKYKKNLKALYIVHPSRWVQLLMTAMNAVLSPKFAKKIRWVDTLSELARAVPISQISIPAEVYQFNATKEEEIAVPTPGLATGRFFGVALEQLMGIHGELGLPAPVADALDYLYTHALEVQDLFRRAPATATLQQVRQQYEAAGHVSVAYATWGEHAAAAVLKTYVRELPQPVVPPHYYELIRQMPDPQTHGEEAAAYARDVVLPALADPPCVSLLLAALFGLLRAVADHSGTNNMTSARLATAWAPNFVHSSQPDLDISMCSVTRFTEAARRTLSDDEDDDVLDLNNGDSEDRPNVVTLAKLMVDRYQDIFKPTLEAAEALTKQQAQRMQRPPLKPPRTAPTMDVQQLAAQASDEDIAALVEEIDDALVSDTNRPRAVTAEDIARRLKAEQNAAARPGVAADVASSGPSDALDDEIIVSKFV